MQVSGGELHGANVGIVEEDVAAGVGVGVSVGLVSIVADELEAVTLSDLQRLYRNHTDVRDEETSGADAGLGKV